MPISSASTRQQPTAFSIQRFGAYALLLTVLFCLAGVANLRAAGGSSNEAAAAGTPNENVTGRGPAAVYTLPPNLLQKANALTRIRTLLGFGDPAWTIVVLLLVLKLRWPAHLQRSIQRLTGRRWLQEIIFLGAAVLFACVLPLPLAIYGHHVAIRYGLSVQTWAGWALDQGKALLLALIVFTPLLLLLFWMIRRWPRRWWLCFWLAMLPLMIFAVFISPIWIEPMFDHFSPLENSNPQIVARLEQLAHHAGLNIPPSRILLMRASDKVTGLNAYVTGIGSSRRIVIWDNTLHKLPPDQVLFITAHEIGHSMLHHIGKGLLFSAVLLLAGLWLASLLGQGLIRRFGGRWEIRSLEEWSSITVLGLVFSVFGFLASPVVNGFSRAQEHQADVYGLEAIHGIVAHPQDAAEHAFITLGRTYLESPHPNPLSEFWLASHPSIADRVRFAARYNPWRPGGHPRYFPK